MSQLTPCFHAENNVSSRIAPCYPSNMLFYVRKRMRFTGGSLFPVMPHVLDIFVVLEHVEHLLEKKAAISAHLSEAHSSVMQMYVTVELNTIIIAHRAKNCKRYSSGAVKTSVSGCFFSAACR